MKIIASLALLVALSACTQRAPVVPAPDVPASAPDATGQGAGGGGRR